MLLYTVAGVVIVLLGCCTLYAKYCFEELQALNRQIANDRFDRETRRLDRAA